MIKEAYCCDRCGKPARAEDRAFVPTGHQADAYGAIDDDGEHVDLCPWCWRNAMLLLIGARDLAWNRQLLLWARGEAKTIPGPWSSRNAE